MFRSQYADENLGLGAVSGDARSMELILGWWERHGRDFPWRRTTDPLKLLVAEMLLQRSRSGSVAKIYLDLFDRWATPQVLAKADVSEIESLIRPLGLPRRAIKIKEVAGAWVERETPPNSSKELQELPGVGPYSANATAIAVSWDSEPCVDSVSIRVLRRYLGDRYDGESDKYVASAVYSTVSKDRWRELNWAILDLAAAICMPRVPRCQLCPLMNRCKSAGDIAT